ncbi:SRPBCC family protein [Geomonas sp.]|uniref:SRPBCC family protein n=1 Tax=Geomonas sp. TaxID=2651584 RepID=UPI002B478D6C|nr:SRPBCC family protein [Geomonas sp.]HJV36129.1 SRPBCC family protein [Geomonas sp.]
MESTQSETVQQKQESKHQRINVGEAERKASMVGGAALALSGLRSLTRKHYLPGLAMMAAGGLVFYRGKTGHCEAYHAMGVDTAHSEGGLRIEKVITINRPRQQVYDFWHQLENLPRFMHHLDSVQMTGERTSHWKARAAGMTVEWDAESTDEQPGREISWRSTGEAELPNQGVVQFSDAPGDRGTELKVIVDYYPPGGAAGKVTAKLMRAINAQQLEEDLKRLKQLLETGEVATAERTFH